MFQRYIDVDHRPNLTEDTNQLCEKNSVRSNNDQEDYIAVIIPDVWLAQEEKVRFRPYAGL